MSCAESTDRDLAAVASKVPLWRLPVVPEGEARLAHPGIPDDDDLVGAPLVVFAFRRGRWRVDPWSRVGDGGDGGDGGRGGRGSGSVDAFTAHDQRDRDARRWLGCLSCTGGPDRFTGISAGGRKERERGLICTPQM